MKRELAVALALALPVMAASADDLKQCSSIQDSAQRLACFDRAAQAAPEKTAAPTNAGEQVKAVNIWADQIRTRIRANVALPRAVGGNPEAVFSVSLRPSGEVMLVKIVRSSGQKDFDEAVQRAILRASPLPIPEHQSVFIPILEIRYRAH